MRVLRETIDLLAPGKDSQQIAALLNEEFGLNVVKSVRHEGWIRVEVVGHEADEIDFVCQQVLSKCRTIVSCVLQDGSAPWR